jgi:hypothetical protein
LTVDFPVQLGVSYDLELLNISPYTGEGSKISNRVFRLSVGYLLPSGKE